MVAAATPRLSSVQLSCFCPFTDRDNVLDQAGAIATLLAHAFEADSEATSIAIRSGRTDAPDWAGLNPIMFSDALKGIASLIAVARHLEMEGA